MYDSGALLVPHMEQLTPEYRHVLEEAVERADARIAARTGSVGEVLAA